MQSIERVEKFLLSGIFARKDVHIIDEQDIDVAVGLSERLHFRAADGSDDMLGKSLCACVEGIQPLLFKSVGQRHHEVGFSRSGAAPEIDRVKRRKAKTRFFKRVAGQFAKEFENDLIGLSRDKILQRHRRIELILKKMDRRVRFAFVFFRIFGSGRANGCLTHSEMDFNRTEIIVEQLCFEKGADVLFKPQDLERVFGLEVEVSRVEMNNFERAQPLLGNIFAEQLFLFCYKIVPSLHRFPLKMVDPGIRIGP